MSIRTIWSALEKLERQRAEALAAAASGGILWIPDNGRGDSVSNGRLRLYDIERRETASEAGADELVALESALID